MNKGGRTAKKALPIIGFMISYIALVLLYGQALTLGRLIASVAAWVLLLVSIAVMERNR